MTRAFWRGGGLLALAILVCGCVFAALAGPAESTRIRTDAFHQLLGGYGSTTKAVQVTANASEFAEALTNAEITVGQPTTQTISTAELAQVKRQLHQGIAALGIPLTAGDWAGLTAAAQTITSAYPARAFISAPPELEVVWRDSLPQNTSMTSGSLTPGTLPAGVVGVSVTGQNAARFGLTVGSRLQLGTARLVVTGIIGEQDPASTFWAADPTTAQPVTETQGHSSWWQGTVFADPSQLGALQSALGTTKTTMTWEYPLALGAVGADQAQDLAAALSHVNNATSALTQPIELAAPQLSFSTGIVQQLTDFSDAQSSVLTVLMLLFVSLIVAVAAVIVLAGRMIATARDGDLAIRRARGAATRQLAWFMVRGTALVTIPAAVIGAALAEATVPGTTAIGWVLAVAALLLAVLSPAAIAAWRYRRQTPPANAAQVLTADTSKGIRAGGLRRLIAEVTAVAAAVAGLVVLRSQGAPASGTDWYLTIAPVLAVIPVTVIILRLYPLIVRGLLRLFADRASVTGYVALASSARSTLATTGAAFALVMALTVAAFGGMVSDSVSSGEVSASWQAIGGDVSITNTGTQEAVITPAVLRQFARVHGVSHVTAVENTTWITQLGQQVPVSAVSPASYAALTASTPFPSAGLGALAASGQSASGQSAGGQSAGGQSAGGQSAGGQSAGGPGVIDVLASPAAETALGGNATSSAGVQLTSQYDMGPIRVRVVGTVASTPAEPGGGPFLVMPLRTLPGVLGAPPAPNLILITGSGIDRAALSAVAGRAAPGSVIAYRADTLHALQDSPLQHGAQRLILLGDVAAAVFGLLNLILALTLGAADRNLTSARLAVLGHTGGRRLALAETLPAVLAAIVAGLTCALILPAVVGSALNLAAFTGTSAATGASVTVGLRPGIVALALPAAAMLVLAIATLSIQAGLARRRGTSGLLRTS